MKTTILVTLILLLIFELAIAKIHVQGHRGARAIFPESALEGFHYALSLGIDFLEFDLAVSKDMQVIISHNLAVNTTLCRFDQEQTPFFTLILRKIKEIGCGLLLSFLFPQQQQVAGAKVPTLSELFELVKESQLPSAQTVQFSIEIKTSLLSSSLTPEVGEFVQLVYEVIRQHDMVKRSIIQSFNHRVLRLVKAIDPELRIAVILYPLPYSISDLVRTAKYLEAEYIFPNYRWITQRQVEELQYIGVKTVPWTANTFKQWDRMIDLGVDGIITDDPQALIEYLKEKRLR